MNAYFGVLLDNFWIAIVLFVFIWIYSWAKGSLGSSQLAILFAVIIVYLTIYQFPELVWIGVIIFVLSVFGKDFFTKIDLKLDRE